SELSAVDLTQVITDEVEYRLERVPGVAAVETWGGYDREIHVALDPERLKALGLPLNGVIEAIRQANVSVPAGQIYRGRFELDLRIPGEPVRPEEHGATVIALRDGAPVQLRQIASIEEGH